MNQDWQAIAAAQERGSSQPDGEGCLAMFYDRPVVDEEATGVEGRVVHKAVTYCRILVAGQPRSIADARVKDEYHNPAMDPRKRFPVAWQAYKEKRAGLAEGTPIEQFPLLSITQVADLKAAGVMAVEQLANMSDEGLPKLGMRGRELRERARQFLTPAGEVEQELRQQVKAQAESIADLTSKLEQLIAAQAPQSADAETPPAKTKKAA